MASTPVPDVIGSTPPPLAHVLHLADRDVNLRFGPMLAQVLPGLCAGGIRTTLVSDDPALLDRLERTPVGRLAAPCLAGWRGWSLPALLTARLTPTPDVLHLWGTGGLWWARRWSRQTGVPLLVHALGVRHAERLAAGPRRRDERVVLAAGGLAAAWRGRASVAAAKFRTVAPGIAPPVVSTDFHTPGREAEGRALAILCVSEFAERDGLAVLVEAVAQLHRRGTDLHAVLIGSGAGSEAVWQCIRDHAASECVSLLDEPALWEKALPEVEVLVVPAGQRELSIVPLLAMGLGKVVITSRDQLADWFVEGTTCWQFTPGSAVELAYLLARVVEQPAAAQELTANALACVRERHSLRQALESLWAVYGEVTAGAASRSEPAP